MRIPKKFVPHPFEYHQEIELEIQSLTNLGHGVGRVDGWVVMVPFALPTEVVRARIFRNHKNYSEGDLVAVVRRSPLRVNAKCELFGRCGGCQYQHFDYSGQLAWKRQQVKELLQKALGTEVDVESTEPSPRPYGYRSKLTPHFEKPRSADFPIGFQQRDRRLGLIDVPTCPIATQAINSALPRVRREVRERFRSLRKGGTVLLRDVVEGVVTDPNAVVSEKIAGVRFRFLAGEFFQNNPFILPRMIEDVLEQAKALGGRFLVDAYCGVGVFSLMGASQFERCVGVEISAQAVTAARNNAALNNIENCEFIAGQAETLFAEICFPGEETVVIIDPPRAGCDEVFLRQLIEFSPKGIVYVSCDPATQARDLVYLTQHGYHLSRAKPFDLFPQTRHIENVVTLQRVAKEDPTKT